jgi:iron complex outermembrane receptor protein
LGGDEPFANLTYDVAFYWLQVKNDIVPYSNGTLFFTAGRTQRMGMEFAGTIQFNNGLSFSCAITASSNKYKEYTVDSVHYGRPGKIADYANNKVVGVPDLFFTLGAKYMPEILHGAYVRVNLQNLGKYFADDANTITVPAYTIINAGIGLDHLNFANDRLFVNAFLGLNNLTDVRYIASAWLNPDYVTVSGKRVPVYIEPGLPSNFVGSIGIGVNL